MTEHTLAVRRRAAVKHTTCPICFSIPNVRCVDEEMNPVVPHPERLALGDIWFEGYDQAAATVNRLEAEIVLLNDSIESVLAEATTAEADLQECKEAREKAEAQVADLTRRVTEAADDIASLQTQLKASEALLAASRSALSAAQAEIKRLQAIIDAQQPTPPPTPTPAPTGTILLGAGGGNVDRSKDDIDIDRRYYQTPSDVATCIADVKKNAVAGIVSWISFKLPVSWASAATGGADAFAKDLYAKLDALNTEVWVSFHHEPEGDGDPALWKKIQDRLSRLVPGGTAGDIKFWLTVTGYGQEHNSAGKTWADLYPVGAPIYGIAYDNPYLQYGVPTAGGALDTSWQEGSVYVNQLAARAKSFGVKAAIGEFGYSNEAFAKDAAWLDRTLKAAKAAGLLGVCYFDTPLNSKRSWTLGAANSTKRAYFYKALAAARA